MSLPSELFGFTGTIWLPLKSVSADAGADSILLTVGAGSGGTAYAQGRVGPSGTFSDILDVLPVGQYNAAGVALADTQIAVLQLTSGGFLKVADQFAPQYEDNTNGVAAVVQKPLSSATYAWSTSTNQGAANAGNIKASAGNLFALSLTNTNAAARFCFQVNTAGAPVAGSASALNPIVVPGNTSQVFVDSEIFGPNGTRFATGIGLAFMTTLAGGTLATAGETFWTAWFI